MITLGETEINLDKQRSYLDSEQIGTISKV